MSATKSQLLATATLHECIAAANARFGVKAKHAPRHAEDAAKLRRAAEDTASCDTCGRDDVPAAELEPFPASGYYPEGTACQRCRDGEGKVDG